MYYCTCVKTQMASASRTHVEYSIVQKVPGEVSECRRVSSGERKRARVCGASAARQVKKSRASVPEEAARQLGRRGLRRRRRRFIGGAHLSEARARYLPCSSRRTQATLFADDGMRRTKAKRLPTLALLPGTPLAPRYDERPLRESRFRIQRICSWIRVATLIAFNYSQLHANYSGCE